MKQALWIKYPNLNTEKLIKWGKLVTITSFAQVLVQAIGFVSGILIIRLCSIQEYAFYVLANTMLGTMTILADSGITTGVMVQGAKVWNDKEKLGAIISTGLYLRKKFAIGSLLVATPVLIYLLRYHKANWLMTALICLSLIPAFLAALSDSLLEVAPKLKQDIVPLQKNQVLAAAVRMVMLVATLFVFPWTFVALLDAGLSRSWANIRLRKISSQYVDANQKPDKQAQKDILVTVKKILPTSIYYCLSGQITVWLISIFGSTKSLAQVGALGGLSTILSLFTVIFNTLIVPRFATLHNDMKTIIKNFLFIQLGLYVVGFLIVVVVDLFSKNILWVLGHSFSTLTKEIVLVAAGGAISLVSTSTNALLSSKGIIVPPFVYIPCVIIIQVGLAFVLPIGKVDGILIYGILTSTCVYLIRVVYFAVKLKSKKYQIA
jgi:O-antigen/teichoic acid export membrane protein